MDMRTMSPFDLCFIMLQPAGVYVSRSLFVSLSLYLHIQLRK